MRIAGFRVFVRDVDRGAGLDLVVEAVPRGAPEPQPWGGMLATFRDPSGNQFQWVQYPK